jgi:hypothetical protein
MTAGILNLDSDRAENSTNGEVSTSEPPFEGENSTNGEVSTSEPPFEGENSTMVDFSPSGGGNGW